MRVCAEQKLGSAKGGDLDGREGVGAAFGDVGDAFEENSLVELALILSLVHVHARADHSVCAGLERAWGNDCGGGVVVVMVVW